MPDILIRGMEMPESCADCPICYDMMECSVSPLRFWNGRTELEQFVFCNERHPSCPLVELPEHGDLIDRGEIVAHYRKCECNLGSDTHLGLLTVHDWIEEGIVYDLLIAPVIVPANKEETE